MLYIEEINHEPVYLFEFNLAYNPATDYEF